MVSLSRFDDPRDRRPQGFTSSRPQGFVSSPRPRLDELSKRRRQERQAARPSVAPAERQNMSINDIVNARLSETQDQGEDEGSPFGRGLGFLVNNPLTQAALKPLQVLDYGRRAVTLGLEELAEGVTGQEFEAQKDDDRSNWDKLNDPEYGVGQLLGGTLGDITPWEWDDKWVDRVGGFVGDVALDPLSYVTFGVGGVAGKGGRALYSSMARQAGREAAEKALKEGGQEAANLVRKRYDDAAQTIGRYGPGSVKDTEVLEALNLQQGLRFGSMKPGAGYRIGGKTRVGETLGEVARKVNRTTGGVRAKYYDTGLGNTTAKWRSPKALVRAHEVIRSGKPESAGGMEMGAALAMTDFHRSMQIGNNAFRGRAERTYKQIGGNKARGRRALEMTTAAENPAMRTEWNDYADELREVAAEFGVEVPKRANFVPHILSEQAQALLRENEDLRPVFGVTVSDLDDPSGVTMARELTSGGKHNIKGIEVDFGKGTIDEVNAEMAKKFGIEGFLDSNITEIYSKYVNRLAADAGLMNGLRSVADKYPELLVATDNPSALLQAFNDVVDEAATKVANKEAVTELRARLTNANRAIGEAEDRAEEAIMKGQSILADAAGENLSALRTLRKETKAELARLQRTEKNLVTRRDKIVDQLSTEIIDMDERAEVLLRQIDSLKEKELNATEALEGAPTSAEVRSRKAKRAAAIKHARKAKQGELDLLEEERELLREVNRRIKYADVKEGIVTGRMESTGVTPRGAEDGTPIPESFVGLAGGDVIADQNFVTVGPAQRAWQAAVDSGEIESMSNPQRRILEGAADRERLEMINRARQTNQRLESEGLIGTGKSEEELIAEIQDKARLRRTQAEMDAERQPQPTPSAEAQQPSLTRNEQRRLSRARDRETRTKNQLQEVLDSPEGQQWLDEWNQVENVSHLRNPNRWGEGSEAVGVANRMDAPVPGRLQAELDAAKSELSALNAGPEVRRKAGRNVGAINDLQAQIRERMAQMARMQERIDAARQGEGFGTTRRVQESSKPDPNYRASDFSSTVPPSRSTRGIIDTETKRMQAMAQEIRDMEERLADLSAVQGRTTETELNPGAMRAKKAAAKQRVEKLEKQVNTIRRKGGKRREKVAKLEATIREAKATRSELEAKARPRPKPATDQSHLALDSVIKRINADEAEAIRQVGKQARSESNMNTRMAADLATSPEGYATRSRMPNRSQIEADLEAVRAAGQRFTLPPEGTKARQLLDSRKRAFTEKSGDKLSLDVAEDVLESSQLVEPYRSSLLERGAITEDEAMRHVTQEFAVRKAIKEHGDWTNTVSKQNLDNAVNDLRRTNEFLIRYGQILAEEGMEPSDALAQRVLRRVIDNDIEALDSEIAQLKAGRGEYIDRETEEIARVMEDVIDQYDYLYGNKQQANNQLRADKKWKSIPEDEMSPDQRMAVAEFRIEIFQGDIQRRTIERNNARRRLNAAVKRGDDKAAAKHREKYDSEVEQIEESRELIRTLTERIVSLQDQTMTGKEREVQQALEMLADAPMSQAAADVLRRVMSDEDVYNLENLYRTMRSTPSEAEQEFLDFVDILMERQGVETDSLRAMAPMDQLQLGLRFQAAREYEQTRELFNEVFDTLGLRKLADTSKEMSVGYNVGKRTHNRKALRAVIEEKLTRERGMSGADWALRDLEAQRRRLDTINRNLGKQRYAQDELVETPAGSLVKEPKNSTQRLPEISRPTVEGPGVLEQARDARNLNRAEMEAVGSFEGLPSSNWREVLFGEGARKRPTQPMISPQGEQVSRGLAAKQPGIPRPSTNIAADSPAAQGRVLSDQLGAVEATEQGLADVVARQQRVRPVAQQAAEGLEQSIAGRQQTIESLDDIINQAGTPLFPEVDEAADRVRQQFDEKIGWREEELGQIAIERAARVKAIDDTLEKNAAPVVETRRAIADVEEMLYGQPQQQARPMPPVGGEVQGPIAQGGQDLGRLELPAAGQSSASRSYDERIAEAQDIADRVTKKTTKINLGQFGVEEIVDDFNKAMADMGLPATETALVRSLLAEAVGADQEAKLLQKGADALEAAIAKGEINKLRTVAEVSLLPNWKPMAEVLTKGSSDNATNYYMEQSLHRQFKRVDEAMKTNRFWKAIEAYTRFFKTYATARPDFHVRNGISAVFMNTTDGVPVRYNFDALKAWRRLSESPDDFMASLLENGSKKSDFAGLTNKQLHDAITVAWGTGAGGQFTERGVGGTSNRAIINNPWTRGSQKLGTYVEGPVRLAAAMDSMKRGVGIEEAYERVARLHFDYSDVSEFDQWAKRIIPFWTFMSRNIPLQLTQMWAKPKTYAWYNSFVRNFSTDGDPLAPEYWAEGGGFPVTEGEDQWWLMPDLAHNRIGSDIESILNLGTFNDAGLVTSASPLFVTPAEVLTNTDLFTGRQYGEDDVLKLGGLEGVLAPFTDAANVSQDGVIDEQLLRAMRGLAPMWDQAARVAPDLTTGGSSDLDKERQAQTFLRYLGLLPARKLGPEQRKVVARGQYYDQQDQQRQEAAYRRALAEAG